MASSLFRLSKPLLRSFSIVASLFCSSTPIVNSVSIKLIDSIYKKGEKIFSSSKFYREVPNYSGYQTNYNRFFDSSYAAGEGCLIPSEIVYNAENAIEALNTIF